MSNFMTGQGEFAISLLLALGEDPSKTRGVVLRCYVDEVVTATIEKFVDINEGDEVVKVVKTVTWKEQESKAA